MGSNDHFPSPFLSSAHFECWFGTGNTPVRRSPVPEGVRARAHAFLPFPIDDHPATIDRPRRCRVVGVFGIPFFIACVVSVGKRGEAKRERERGPWHFFAGRPANSRAKNLSSSAIAWAWFGGLEVREVSLRLQSDIGNVNASAQRNK